jgi:hypothetical protein
MALFEQTGHPMKKFTAALLFLALSSPALADGTLPAGKPAGIHQAQLDMNNGLVLLAGAAAIAVGIAVATSGGNNPAVMTTSAVGTAS